jgi:hypothetical protein
MKNIAREIILMSSKINRRHLEIILVVLSLALFILSAAAPETGGGVTFRSIILPLK